MASLFLCNEYRRETLRLPFFISKAKEPLPSAAEAFWLFAVFFVFVFFLFIAVIVTHQLFEEDVADPLVLVVIVDRGEVFLPVLFFADQHDQLGIRAKRRRRSSMWGVAAT